MKKFKYSALTPLQIVNGLLYVKQLADPDPACRQIVELIDHLIDHIPNPASDNPARQGRTVTGGIEIRVLDAGHGGLHNALVKNTLFIPRKSLDNYSNDQGWDAAIHTIGEYQHDPLWPRFTRNEDKAQAELDVLLNSVQRRYPNLTNLSFDYRHGGR